MVTVYVLHNPPRRGRRKLPRTYRSVFCVAVEVQVASRDRPPGSCHSALPQDFRLGWPSRGGYNRRQHVSCEVVYDGKQAHEDEDL